MMNKFFVYLFEVEETNFIKTKFFYLLVMFRLELFCEKD